MPFKIKGIRRMFYLPCTALAEAKRRKIKNPKIIPIKFKDM